jgi:hypothetical protein
LNADGVGTAGVKRNKPVVESSGVSSSVKRQRKYNGRTASARKAAVFVSETLDESRARTKAQLEKTVQQSSFQALYGWLKELFVFFCGEGD